MWIKLLRGVLTDLVFAIRIAWLPTLRAVLNQPSLLFRPRELSRVFIAHVWELYGDGTDEAARPVKEGLVRPWARGVVLDIGAGHGHLVRYLARPRVSAYVALEPNAHMHARIRQKAHAGGFREEDGSLLLLPFAAQDAEKVCEALAAWAARFRIPATDLTSSTDAPLPPPPGQVVDTLVCVLTLCSVPSPTETLRALVARTLRPHGALLFYEHVRNPHSQVARVQDVVAPLWRVFFDGCVVGMDGVRAVRDAGRGGAVGGGVRGEDGEEDGWESMETWGKEGEDPDSLFWHQVGRCVKRGET